MMQPRRATLVAIGTATFYLLQSVPPLLPSVLLGQGANQLQAQTLPASSRRPARVPGSIPSGPRGNCQAAFKTTQTLLFQNRVGQTVSTQPVFLWHLSGDSSIDVQFVLADPTQEDPIYRQVFAKPRAGFMALQLPADRQLVPGKQYLWSVSLLCNPKDGSQNPTAQGRIESIAPPPNLTRQLEVISSPIQRAELYAQQGLWYDALGTLWTAYRARPTDTTTQDAFFSLLERMGHGEVVQQEQNRRVSLRSGGDREG